MRRRLCAPRRATELCPVLRPLWYFIFSLPVYFPAQAVGGFTLNSLLVTGASPSPPPPPVLDFIFIRDVRYRKSEKRITGNTRIAHVVFTQGLTYQVCRTASNIFGGVFVPGRLGNFVFPLFFKNILPSSPITSELPLYPSCTSLIFIAHCGYQVFPLLDGTQPNAKKRNVVSQTPR